MQCGDSKLERSRAVRLCSTERNEDAEELNDTLRPRKPIVIPYLIRNPLSWILFARMTFHFTCLFQALQSSKYIIKMITVYSTTLRCDAVILLFSSQLKSTVGSKSAPLGIQ